MLQSKRINSANLTNKGDEIKANSDLALLCRLKHAVVRSNSYIHYLHLRACLGQGPFFLSF